MLALWSGSVAARLQGELRSMVEWHGAIHGNCRIQTEFWSEEGTMRQRGVYEKVTGSDDWWIRYVDAEGRYRREKAGTKSMALDLYRKRKTEALQGKKLPERLRRRVVPFGELCDDARNYSQANNAGHASDSYRITKL